MDKKNVKTEKRCKPLIPRQTKALAESLISQLDRERRGTTRKRRITAPAGAVMIF